MGLAISYVELPAVDLGAAKDFYSAAFGWSFVDYGPSYAASTDGGVEVGLNGEATVGAAHVPGAENAVGPLVLFSTADLVATEAAVRSAGGEIVSAAYAYPGGHRFHFADPSGNILGVYESV